MASVAQPEPPPASQALPSLREVLIHRQSDSFSEALIYFMVVFSPWAFGTTQWWGIWTMNVCGYLLGLLLTIKCIIRRWRGHQAERWDSNLESSYGSNQNPLLRWTRTLTILLAVLTVAILGYCLVAGLNARSAYDRLRMDFIYHSFVSWLPHSYDRSQSLQSFANYLAIACFFWAVRDWLLGKTAAEIRSARLADTRTTDGAGSENRSSRRRQDAESDRKTEDFSASLPRRLLPVQNHSLRSPLPGRLKRLFWVLSVNGALLGIEGIVQRLSGTGKPLWLLQMKINAIADAQFGPYGYRSNAAQYFNLLWPAALGFWWILRREARRVRAREQLTRSKRDHWLLPCTLIMAACPIISGSRGGAFIALATLGMAALILLASEKRRHPSVKFGLLLLFGAAIAIGLYFGWDLLNERLKDTEQGYVQRESMYETARQIARDYPLFGTGPGSFEAVFQLYRSSPEEYWPAQLHNDWLETRVTFGWMGSAFIALALAAVLARWFLPGGLRANWRLVSLLWVALAGCLLHARFDYPMQIYSTLLLFVLLCSILFTLSRR